MDPTRILTGIQDCYKLGQILIEVCQTWKAAEEQVREHVIIIESVWLKIKNKIAFVQRISTEIESEHCRIIDEVLLVLISKLSVAVTSVRKVAKPAQSQSGFLLSFGPGVNKLRYIRMKSTIQSMIQELEVWQRLFDPCWLLMVRVNKPEIDEQLRRGVDEEHAAMKDSVPSPAGGRKRKPFSSAPFASAQGLRAALRPGSERQDSIYMPVIDLEAFPILYSTAKVARPRSVQNGGWYIIDSVQCRRGGDINAMHEDVRKLAHKLKQADPSAFGLLTCRGVMRIKDAFSGYIASFDFVFNKPEGLDVLQSLRQSLLSSAGVISLNRRVYIARELVNSISYVHTFNFVHKNIWPESVLLFEDEGSSRCSTFLVGFESFRSADGARHGLRTLHAWTLDTGRQENFQSSHFKAFFTDLAKNRLPPLMGQRYTSIVLTCLTCLDANNDGIGDEAEVEDLDGILVGVRFIEKILTQINEIAI
ncbi:CBL-interacting protein kinase 29 [Cytospora mali]|uniref:CBL-interacting protein kinase 29 n=1 Tax=Cytospora mali TaxID=578113 RepID=A0A194VRK2_CYTMA|nr:CBL-interacting protein kinase 29 [Valsa mali]